MTAKQANSLITKSKIITALSLLWVCKQNYDVNHLPVKNGICIGMNTKEVFGKKILPF